MKKQDEKQNWVKVEKKILSFVPFEMPGDSVIGKLKGKRMISTTFGESDILELDVITEDGEVEEVCVGVKANLKYYEWDEMIGKEIKVEFVKPVKNVKTGHTYKEFEIYIVE